MRMRVAAIAVFCATVVIVEGCALIVGLDDHYEGAEAGVIVIHDEGGVVYQEGSVVVEEAGPNDAFVPPPSPLVLDCEPGDGGWKLDCSFGVGACVNTQFPAAIAPLLIANDGGYLLAGSTANDLSNGTYLSELSSDGAVTRLASAELGTPEDIAIVPPFDSLTFSDATCPFYGTVGATAASGGSELAVDLYSAPLKITTTRIDVGTSQRPVRLLSANLVPPHPIATFLTNFDDLDASSIPGTTTIDLYAATGTEFSHVFFEDPRSDAGDAPDGSVRFGRARGAVSLAGGTWLIGEQASGAGSALYIPDGATRGLVETLPGRLDDVARLSSGDAVAVAPTDGGIVFQILGASGMPGAASQVALAAPLTSDALRLVTTDTEVLAIGVTEAREIAVFEAVLDPDGGAPLPRRDLPNGGVSLVPIGDSTTIGGVLLDGGALYIGLLVTTPAAPYAVVVRLVK